MGKLFGTDGIRGIAGQTLTAELAFHVGQAVAAVLTEKKGSRPLVTIGKDTRISSDMLEAALMAGICSVGGDVMPLGTIPTPAVAFLTVQQRADAGEQQGRCDVEAGQRRDEDGRAEHGEHVLETQNEHSGLAECTCVVHRLGTDGAFTHRFFPPVKI